MDHLLFVDVGVGIVAGCTCWGLAVCHGTTGLCCCRLVQTPHTCTQYQSTVGIVPVQVFMKFSRLCFFFVHVVSRIIIAYSLLCTLCCAEQSTIRTNSSCIVLTSFCVWVSVCQGSCWCHQMKTVRVLYVLSSNYPQGP